MIIKYFDTNDQPIPKIIILQHVIVYTQIKNTPS